MGTPAECEQWVVETYLEALNDVKANVPFIHRTNMSNGTIAQEMFLEKYPCERKYISWKYSNAHMYSHPVPQFETLFDAWGVIDLSKVRVLYTVRNDDFHNLRGCNPSYIAEYVRGMKMPYVDGFSWGADGYLWAKNFQHRPGLHLADSEYSFEKDWAQFEMGGSAITRIYPNRFGMTNMPTATDSTERRLIGGFQPPSTASARSTG